MRLLVVGLSHRTAPVELRECVDFAQRRARRGARRRWPSAALASESVVLSTCNRAEVYAVVESEAASRPRLRRFFSDYHQLDHGEMAQHLYALASAATRRRHLFRVAAGLDSLVVGEPQILGQVKAAYTTASDACSSPARCSTACSTPRSRSASGCGSETGLGEGAVSVSYAAIALAKKIFGKLSGLGVLVLGAGEMAELTAVHLQAQQVRQITIASRTLAAAEDLAARLGAAAVPWAALDRALGRRGHRRHRDRRDRAGADPRTRRRGRCGRGATGRSSSSTSPCRATSRPRSAISSRCSSTTSTTCRRSSRRTSRAGRRSSTGPKRSSPRRWRGSRRGCSRATSSRRSSRCASGSRRSASRSSCGSSRSWRACRPRHGRASTRSRRLIVEKLLLTPTEQLKAVSDETTVVAYADALNRLFRLAAEEQARTASDTDRPARRFGA